MLEKTHDHIVAEIELGSRVDSIVVVVALLFSTIALCTNSTVAAIFFTAGISDGDVSPVGINLYLGIMAVLTVGINAIALAGLLMGRRMRQKLLTGLVAMYTDNNVEKYYDKSLLSDYSSRYRTFAGVMILFAIAAIAVPLVLRLFRF